MRAWRKGRKMIKADVLRRAINTGRIIDIQKNHDNVAILLKDGSALIIRRGRGAGYSVMTFKTPEVPGPQCKYFDFDAFMALIHETIGETMPEKRLANCFVNIRP